MDAFIGEIRPFGFDFAPQDWALCNGQILPIQNYAPLYAVLGARYGGDGKTTFALPDIKGTVLIGSGQLSGNGTVYTTGERGGKMEVPLQETQIPAHTHYFNGLVTTDPNAAPQKETAVAAGSSYLSNIYEVPPPTTKRYGNFYTQATPDTSLNQDTVSITGNNQPHNNMQPYLVINYCICTNGIFPPQTKS